ELVVQIIGNAGQLGQVQTGVLQTSLRDVYLRAGVLVSDSVTSTDTNWNIVKRAEAHALALQEGLSIQALTEAERQRLAVHRSRTCSLLAWVSELEKLQEAKPIAGKMMLPNENERRALSTILTRLRPLTQGEAARMFGGLNEGEEPLQVDSLG